MSNWIQIVVNWCKRRDWKADLEAVTQRLEEAEQLITTLVEAIQALEQLSTEATTFQTDTTSLLNTQNEELKTSSALLVERLDKTEQDVSANRVRLNDTETKIHSLNEVTDALLGLTTAESQAADLQPESELET